MFPQDNSLINSTGFLWHPFLGLRSPCALESRPVMSSGPGAEWRSKTLREASYRKVPGPGSYEAENGFVKQTTSSRSSSPSIGFGKAKQRVAASTNVAESEKKSLAIHIAHA